MSIKHYNKKVVLSGNILEVYEYQNTRYFDIQSKKSSCNSSSSSDKSKNKKDSLNRSIKKIRNYIATNYTKRATQFVTLGFNSDITDIQIAKKKLERFNSKLKNKLKESPKYIGTIEYQENGRIHFHIIYFNLPYIPHDELLKIWNNGSLWIEPVTYGLKSFDCLTRYILKQSKLAIDYKNIYFRSKANLKEPKEIKNDLVVSKVINHLTGAECTSSYKGNNEYVGEYSIKSFDISKLNVRKRAIITAVCS